MIADIGLRWFNLAQDAPKMAPRCSQDALKLQIVRRHRGIATSARVYYALMRAHACTIARANARKRAHRRPIPSQSSCTGTLVHRYTNKPIHRYIGTSLHQYSDTPVHQDIGTPDFRIGAGIELDLGVHRLNRMRTQSTPVHRYTDMPDTGTPVNQYTGTPVHQYDGTPVHQHTELLNWCGDYT